MTTDRPPLHLRAARPEDFPAVQQLLELYQYELSDIWPQDIDGQARYGYDLARHRLGQRFHAHVALVGTQYAGCALVAPAIVTRSTGHWMEQFFVRRSSPSTRAILGSTKPSLTTALSL